MAETTVSRGVVDAFHLTDILVAQDSAPNTPDEYVMMGRAPFSGNIDRLIGKMGTDTVDVQLLINGVAVLWQLEGGSGGTVRPGDTDVVFDVGAYDGYVPITDAPFLKDQEILLKITAVTGSPANMTFQIDATYDRAEAP